MSQGCPKNGTDQNPICMMKFKQVLDDYAQGTRPTKEQVQEWHRYQIFSFLQGLPEKIPVEDCQYFEDILELEKRNDAGVLLFFLCYLHCQRL